MRKFTVRLTEQQYQALTKAAGEYGIADVIRTAVDSYFDLPVEGSVTYRVGPTRLSSGLSFPAFTITVAPSLIAEVKAAPHKVAACILVRKAHVLPLVQAKVLVEVITGERPQYEGRPKPTLEVNGSYTTFRLPRVYTDEVFTANVPTTLLEEVRAILKSDSASPKVTAIRRVYAEYKPAGWGLREAKAFVDIIEHDILCPAIRSA